MADERTARGDRPGAPAPDGRSSSPAAARSPPAYDKALASLDGLTPLAEPPGSRGNVYKYIVLLPPGTDRAAVKQELA